MRYRAFIIILCLFFAGRVSGADYARIEMLYRNWSTREGLPQDRVMAIEQTRDGYLWLGTEGGLVRFDGSRIQVYGIKEGLGGTTILSLSEGRDGTLWVGTLAGGVSAIRDGKVLRTYGVKDGLPSATVVKLAVDGDGHLWAAGREGLARMENEKFTSIPVSPADEKPRISAMYCDREGTVWVALSNWHLRTWKNGHWEEAKGNAPNRVSAFCEDNIGRLWVATGDHQLCCREGEKWSSYRMPGGLHASILSLTAGADGTIWAAAYREGLYGLRDGQFIKPSVRDENFLGLSEVALGLPDGQLALGTSSQGLFTLTPSRIQMATIEDGESNRVSNIIGGLIEIAPGELLVGTQGRGFFRWSAKSTSPLQPLEGIPPNMMVNTMVRAKDGGILAGTSAGLYRFMEGAWSKTQMPSDIWEICLDDQGGAWLGFGSGQLCYFSNGELREVAYGSEAVAIKGMAQEADGTLWVGTRGNGLYRQKGSKWQRFGREQGLQSEVIRVIHIGRNGDLWVGTAGGGLALWNGDRFIALTTSQGLPNDTVSQITTDEDGRLWVGTHRGFAVFDAGDLLKIRAGDLASLNPVLIGRPDGLLSEECTIVPPQRLVSGELAFGTTRGFAMLNPRSFIQTGGAPTVRIEGLFADGKLETPPASPLLPAGTGRVELQFTAFHYLAPERLSFRTRLIGLESQWVPTKERRIEYRNLAPGNYRFEVEASFGNGKWTPVPADIEFKLLPHFWETTWFRVLAGLGLIGAVGYAVRFRERRRAQRRIEALERKRAVDAERARIARDLHDDVGASLTQVALLSELVSRNLAAKPDRAREQASEIFTTAQDMTRALDEIVWAVDPSHDTVERFAVFLGTLVQNTARAAGLTSRFEMPEALPSSPLPSTVRHHLYLAIKEVLHNTIKHAAASEVSVSLMVDDRWLTLTIKDNGKGFDPEKLVLAPGADGLLNLQKRLEQIGGTCARQSAPGAGTSVEMRVPMEHETNTSRPQN